MLKKKWFTLIEIILVVLISSSIILIMYRLLETLPKVKNFNDARQTLIQETNDIMDRFAVIFQDYTVDYEEYYSRKALGCTLSGWYCKEYTMYGNWHWSSQEHLLYYNVYNSTTNTPPYSFWEYKNTFWAYRWDTDNDWSVVWDADDRDEWKWAIAIPNTVNELYLISHDGSRRIFLRRFLHEYTAAEKTLYGSTGFYTIQMLKLRGFDAWSKHNIDPNSSSGVFDGQTDTWACDYGQMYICNWSGVHATLYPNYKLPKNIDDWRVDLFDEKINITDRKIDIYPQEDPNLAWADMQQQINPYIRISLTAGLSEHLASNRNWWGTWGFQYTLENIFDTKGFYIQ